MYANLNNITLVLKLFTVSIFNHHPLCDRTNMLSSVGANLVSVGSHLFDCTPSMCGMTAQGSKYLCKQFLFNSYIIYMILPCIVESWKHSLQYKIHLTLSYI